MSMRAPSSSHTSLEPMMDMNMTPLIDVMLVLIIMLIITIPKQIHVTGMALPSDAKIASTPVVVNLEIDFDGTVLWNQSVLPNRAALEQKLLAIAAAADKPEIHLRANRLVAYKSVAGVLATAQRLGVDHIGLVGNEMRI